MSDYTKGEWTLETQTTRLEGVKVAFDIHGPDGHTICRGQSMEHLGDGVGIHEAACLANARLLTSAPKLLEACQTARALTPDGTHTAKVLDEAIAAATGELQ